MSLGVWKSSKKHIKFFVVLHLEELSSVPFVSGVIFAKLRLLQGGSFCKYSDREEIIDHRVCWNSDFEFECKLTATLSTGILDPCTCRISVRREAQGGKSFQKLGFADINLAEYAGGTPISRPYLLEEYTSSARANNALLRVTICMRVKEGDFCFKVPSPSTPAYLEAHPGTEKRDPEPQVEKEVNQGEHSRQSSSSDSGVVREIPSDGSLERNSGRNSALSSAVIVERENSARGSSRVDATRVDPENLIDELLRESNLESLEGGGGLSLFIGKDGTGIPSAMEQNMLGDETKRKPNTLPVWGNAMTMNLNPLILTNIQTSPYFKGPLNELKTYHEVVDEIYYKVKHLEPWEKGSRRTSGQTGMCGGVRGVGAGGIISTAFCLLYKLFTMRLTRKQVMGLINHPDSPYIRALGLMYVRFTQPPADLWDWFESYIDDPEEVDVRAGGGQPMTIGEMTRLFLTKLDWFSSLFPRIPVPIQIGIDKKLAALKHSTSTDVTPRKPPPELELEQQLQQQQPSIDIPLRSRSDRAREDSSIEVREYSSEVKKSSHRHHSSRSRSRERRKDRRGRDSSSSRSSHRNKDRGRSRSRSPRGHRSSHHRDSRRDHRDSRDRDRNRDRR